MPKYRITSEEIEALELMSREARAAWIQGRIDGEARRLSEDNDSFTSKLASSITSWGLGCLAFSCVLVLLGVVLAHDIYVDFQSKKLVDGCARGERAPCLQIFQRYASEYRDPDSTGKAVWYARAFRASTGTDLVPQRDLEELRDPSEEELQELKHNFNSANVSMRYLKESVREYPVLRIFLQKPPVSRPGGTGTGGANPPVEEDGSKAPTP